MIATWKPIASRATTPLIYVALVVMWEIGVRAFKAPVWILPSPSAIATTASEWAPELAYNSFVTLVKR